MAITRLLTWRCVGAARRRFSPATKLVSYGPCQTPALHLCGARAREIEAFHPQPFSRIHVDVEISSGAGRKEALTWKLHNTNDAVDGENNATFDRKTAEAVVDVASLPGTCARVINVDEISERIASPVGLNTVRLLSAGSKAMGMSPKKVMSVAEKLYSAGKFVLKLNVLRVYYFMYGRLICFARYYRILVFFNVHQALYPIQGQRQLSTILMGLM